MHEERKIIKVVAQAARYGGGRYGFPDNVMKNFALRISYISDTNERQNQVPLEELGNKQTDSLTDILALLWSDMKYIIQI